MLTQEDLKKELHYDENTGIFTRAITRGKIKAGSIAGGIHPSGYIHIRVHAKTHAAHRLAWLYVNGEFPKFHTDHINGNKLDNRVCNLRSVTCKENAINRSIKLNNTSGVIGVSFRNDIKKWKVRISISGVDKNIGTYGSLLDAVAARMRANKEYGYHENHGRPSTCKRSKTYQSKLREILIPL